MSSQRDKEMKGMRKPVPHGRSFSLQMLTNRPTSAPLQDEMYTETLQPMRSPPSYNDNLDQQDLAPPLAYNEHDLGDDGERPSNPPREPFGRKFNGDAAIASSFSSTSLARRDRGARAVSMPVKSSSPYDSMFTFSTQLPEDLSRTLVVPAFTTDALHDGELNNQSARSQSPMPFAAQQRIYSPEGMRMSYISDGRRSASGSNSPVPSRNSKERPATGSRKTSMLNTLGGWLDKRQQSSSEKGQAG